MFPNRPGRKQRTSCPMLPKIAVHGNFPLGFGHFISEITNGKQWKENPPPAPWPKCRNATPCRLQSLQKWIPVSAVGIKTAKN